MMHFKYICQMCQSGDDLIEYLRADTWGGILSVKALTFLVQTASSSEYPCLILGMSGFIEGELVRWESRLYLSVAASRACEALWLLLICCWSLSSLYCARRLRVMGVPPSSWTWGGFGTSILVRLN